MPDILVSTAYLPPSEYFSLILRSGRVMVESEENYLKQSYRNRCYILSAHGPQLLSVPVYQGSQHKTPVKEIRIDYSKRWQQVHLRAITAAYGSSPYFQFYFENIEKIISRKTDFLIDLNMELARSILKMLGLKIDVALTTDFKPVGKTEHDFRYSISPKRKPQFIVKEYMRVFDKAKEGYHRLSIIDLIFNTGPEAVRYL
jgi:WbqC-like protein family